MAKAYTIVDNFDDNSRDTSLWNEFGSGVAEANGHLELTLAAGSTSYHGYTSATTYDLTASDVRVKIVDAGNQALASLEAYPIFLQADSNNNINFLIAGNFLRAYKKVAGVSTQIASTAYVADTHRFLRIREASGTTYWDYSADGITWTNLTSAANPITVTALTVALEAGTYASEASSSTVKFDELNTLYLTTGNKLPGVGYAETNADVDTNTWTNPSYITADDTSYSRGFTYSIFDTPILRELRLVVDSDIQTTSIESGETITGSTLTLGGASNLWGMSSITPTQLESKYFGIALAAGLNTPSTETNYLIGREFNFDVPSTANISGLKVNLELLLNAAGGGLTAVDADFFQLQAYYQWQPSISGGGQSGGSVWTERLNWSKREKSLRHRVYAKSGEFIGEWGDVQDDPSFKQQVNTLLSTMDINIARTDLQGARSSEDLTTEADETILSEADEIILADTTTPAGIGTGTDLDTNLDYRLTAYYGEFVELTTEDGEPILTESYEIVMVEDGAPNGKDIYTGYITDTEADWGSSETVRASTITHSNELNNIMFETSDTKAVDFATQTGTIGLAGAGPYDNTALGQSFTMVGSVDVSRITVTGKRWGSLSSSVFPKLTLTLRNATPTSPGAVIATTEVYVTNVDDDEIAFVFSDYVSLTNGNTYSFEIVCDMYKTGGNVTYPVTLQTGTSYAGGQLYKQIGGGAWAADSSTDLLFTVWQAGGNTTVPMLSQSPSAMLRQVIDFANTRGARATYDASTIEETGTTVSYTFKGMTCAEAIEQILKLCPGDWYYWYDIGSNRMHLHARPTTRSKTITLKKDIVGLKVKKSIKNMVNDVLLTGGGDPALYVRTQDTTSQQTYRRGLKKLSDSRVTIAATATTINQAEIDRGSVPVYNGSGKLVTSVSYDPDEIAGNIYIEDYTLGELLELNGFGNTEYDGLELQLSSYTYSPEVLSIEVGTLLPKISKRIEDIRRNLDNLSQVNQPSAPS